MIMVNLNVCIQRNANASTLITLQKFNPTWTKDLKIRPDTLNLTDEKGGSSFQLISKGNILLEQNTDFTGPKNKNK